MYVDNELIFWDKVDASIAGVPTSLGVFIGPLRVSNPEPIRAFLSWTKDYTLEGASVTMFIQHRRVGAGWVTVTSIQLDSITLGITNSVVFSLPSNAEEEVRIYFQGSLGFSAGIISAGINMDQQLNG